MGRLRNIETEHCYPLPARCLIGRGSQCLVPLESPFASREHAVIEHRQGQYHVRNLSPNGLNVNARPLGVGDVASLEHGTVLSFDNGARLPCLEFDEEAPPRLLAQELRTKRIEVADDRGRLALSEAGSGTTVVVGYERALGGYIVDDEGNGQDKGDGSEELVTVGAEVWRIYWPVEAAATAPVSGVPVALTDGMLRIRTDPTMEEVEVLLHVTRSGVAAVGGEREIISGSRYAETLLALACKKRDDLTRGLDARSAGWVTNAELMRLVGARQSADSNLPYLHTFRIRKLFERANVLDAGKLFERDRGSLRLAVDRFEVIVSDLSG